MSFLKNTGRMIGNQNVSTLALFYSFPFLQPLNLLLSIHDFYIQMILQKQRDRSLNQKTDI